MLDVLNMLQVALPIGYLVCALIYARHFAVEHSRLYPAGSGLLYSLIAVHAVYLFSLGASRHAFPLATKAEFLSLLALCVALVFAVTQRLGGNEGKTGIFYMSMALPFQLASSLLIQDNPPPHPLLHEHPIYGIHVLFTMLGFVALTVGAIEALMYVMLSRQLKRRELGLIFRRLPPLMEIERTSRLATVCGLALLGAGLGLGHLVAIYALDAFNAWDPKIVLMDLAWLGYLAGFGVARSRQISGIRAAYCVLIAYCVLMITMIVTNVVLHSFHSFQTS